MFRPIPTWSDSLKKLTLTRTSALALASLVLLLSLLTGRAAAETATGTFSAPPKFGANGLAFAVFAGGTVEQLETAAGAAGASGVWAQDSTGAQQLLVVGGPAFLRDPFKAKIPNGFAGATAVALIRDPNAPPLPTASATPSPSGSPTPVATPATAPSSSTYPQVGAPSPLIAISGNLRPDSASQFAWDFTTINNLPAVKEPIAVQQVSYIRMCRWDGADEPSRCTQERSLATDVRNPSPVSILFDLPPRDRAVYITGQLCNPSGCGDYFNLGVAVVAKDGAYYVAAGFRGSSQFRPYLLDPRIRDMVGTYSDGFVTGAVKCGGPGVCASGNFDNSIAPGLTVTARAIDGSVISAQFILLRGSRKELGSQQRTTAPAGGVLGQVLSTGVVTTGTINSLGVTMSVGSVSQTTAGLYGPYSLSAPSPSGASVTIDWAYDAVPTNTALTLSLASDLPNLVAKAPPPSGNDFIFAAYATAGQITQTTGSFPKPVRVLFFLPKSVVPQGSVAKDLTLASWDGSKWVVVSDAAVTGSDGSITIPVWVNQFSILAVMRRGTAS